MYVSMAIMNLRATAANEIMFARDFFCKNFERKNCHVGGVVLVLVSPVCIRPDFSDCFTGEDVFKKVLFLDGTDDG